MVEWMRTLLPSQGHGFHPWSGKIPLASGKLSSYTTPTESALQPMSHNYWVCVLQLLKPMCLEPVRCTQRSLRNEKSACFAHCKKRKPEHSNKDDPVQRKNKIIIIIKRPEANSFKSAGQQMEKRIRKMPFQSYQLMSCLRVKVAKSSL